LLFTVVPVSKIVLAGTGHEEVTAYFWNSQLLIFSDDD
jgi:hypothetical protein